VNAKKIFKGLIIAAWLIGGAFLVAYLAGVFYFVVHKTSPVSVDLTTWYTYWQAYGQEMPEKKRLQGSIGFAVFFVYIAPILAILINMKGRSLHGDARWANQEEIKAANLYADKGILLGKMGSKYLMMDSDRFIMLNAPTRSGKGVGTVIPNLLNWPDSVLVVDLKGENFQITSGFRAKHGQEVYKFSPYAEDFKTHRFNPLSYVNRDPKYLVGDILNVGYMLYPKRDGDGGFWNDMARTYFLGVALYCLESDFQFTLGEIYRRGSGVAKLKEFWQEVVQNRVSASGKPLSQPCLNALSEFSSNSDNTLTSIRATFSAPLGIFSNPIFDAATSGDDFDLRMIRKKKMSIYVVIPFKKLSEASLIVNLFFSIAIDQNTDVLPKDDPSLKYQALLILDEFPALGRVDKYEKTIGFIAGYGLRSLMITQSTSQLKSKELYGDEGTRTLLTQHVIKIIYAPRDQQDSQEYSETLGYYGLESKSKGISRGRGSVTNSENTSEQKRALMLPQELREMGDDKIIVLSDNCKPIFADKIFYYKDQNFIKRLLPPVDTPALHVKGITAEESQQIVVNPGVVVTAGALAIDASRMPEVTNTESPIKEEVKAMAEFLFSNVQWVKQTLEPSNHNQVMEMA